MSEREEEEQEEKEEERKKKEGSSRRLSQALISSPLSSPFLEFSCIDKVSIAKPSS